MSTNALEFVDLRDFIQKHAERGACMCGRCFDAPPNPAAFQPPAGPHTADVHFFKVRAVNDPSADDLRRLATEHKGEFNEVNVFDGKEHGYMELGGWLGDQGLALMFMGLGSVLGLWKLHTPESVLHVTGELADKMAGAGMITIVSPTVT
jgi:hypothetical protein